MSMLHPSLTRRLSLYTLAVAALPGVTSAAGLAVLDFDFAHGTVIDNQYAPLGITISVTGGQNIGIVYDSELGGVNGGSIHGSDTDLERLSPAGDPNGWEGGNLGTDYNAGGLLIVQENPPQSSPPTYGSGPWEVISASNYDPDDNVGGEITFDIDEVNHTYNYFVVTLADFEEDGNNYSTQLTGVLGTVETYSFADFIDPGNARYDPLITQGDNHINRLPEIALSNGEELSEVKITFNNSSGSVSGIVFSELPGVEQIPEPSSVVLLGGGLLGLALRRRR